MTKIKNTKKGMAKKTLSISLAVAMLATSNVPVWAAEFTDGTDAAFTSEAPVVEEVAEDVPEAQAIDSVYDVTFETETGKFETNMEWGKNYPVSINVTEKNGKALPAANLKVRFVNSNDQADETFDASSVTFSKSAEDKAAASLTLNFNDKKYVGGVYKLQVYEVDATGKLINVIATSTPITVAKKTITGSITKDYTTGLSYDDAVKYTGFETNGVPKFEINEVFTESSVASDIKGIEDYQIIGEKDIVNANEFFADGHNKITATGNIVSDYYQGTVKVEYSIWRKQVNNAKEAVDVVLPKYTYQYTGHSIYVPKTAVSVIERLTGKEVANALADKFYVGTEVGTHTNQKANVKNEGVLKNYENKANDWATTALDKNVEIVKRDLADTVNTIIEIPTVTQDAHASTTQITAWELWNLLTVKDADGSSVKKESISVKFANNADKLNIADGGEYTAYISSTDSKNFTGTREVTFKVRAHDLGAASFAKESTFFTGAVYTGKQHTFGLTKDNLNEKLGDLRINGIAKALVPGTDYDVNITFGENVNAGKGQIYISGLGSYAGTQKVITFDIAKRDATKVVVPEKVTYNPSIMDADEYDVATSVVAEYKEGTEDVTLTVPTGDYKVERKFVADATGTALAADVDPNQVGQYIETTVTLTNANGNFNFTTFKAYTRIAYKSIGEADVQLVKTDYTYTGKEIFPEYKVVVDGETLELDKDFTADVSHAVNVGTGILKITGKGEYDNSSVTKEFKIVPANVNDLTVTATANVVYNGTQWIGNKTTKELTLKLGENEITDAFTFVYPTSKTANINAGNATVTLKPAKDNKNFVGEKEFTFTIAPAALTGGTLTAYDKNGTKVNIGDAVTYDGTAHTFYSTEYKPSAASVTGSMKFTADDYDIIYRDNTVGKDHKGHILVVAKGNYANATGKYTCANGEVVNNVVINEEFEIKPISITTHTDIVVENGTYAEGKNVDPIVTVTYKGKKLVKDVDYELSYASSLDRTNVTNGKTLTVNIKGIGGFTGTVSNKAWGIDKFDLANVETIVSGTDAEPIVKLINSGVVIDPSEYDLVAENGKVTVTAKADSKHYTGTKTFDIKAALEKPETPMIVDVQVSGNKATVILSGESEGAVGYDYVISTNKNCIVDKDYAKVNKNKLTTDTTFQYVDQGIYYAYCHAWTRDENGKKVFSEWSNAYPFSVTAITPAQPVITGVKVSGSTVTVTYTQAANAEGYDVVLGSKVATVLDEKRPVNYGTLVKKNISGNTVTATFKNVPAGTYYAGLHAFNRTSEDGKKVFSPWSNIKTVKVK